MWPQISGFKIYYWILLGWITQLVNSKGSLPDASQEGLLQQFSSYASMSVFHYTVPPEVTRATWEFASFQDRIDCPRREVNIFIQHGSYPVFSADNSTFPDSFYLKRTSLSKLKLISNYQPSETVVKPIYNPLPGSWFAVAYLSNYEQQHGLTSKCRYSVGSIALWTTAKSVELILPTSNKQTFRTRRPFSYYKFFIQDDIDAFKVVIWNCVIQVKESRYNGHKNCIDFVDIRAKAIPFHQHNSSTAIFNITSESSDNATFIETRPYKSSMYYLIVVSQLEVTFDVKLSLADCGESGLYGRKQREWFITERGLMKSDRYNASQPKEPTKGFQLFSVGSRKDLYKDDPKENSEFNSLDDDVGELPKNCMSTFDFTRIDDVSEFTVNYLLQGRSWYTKWLTVFEKTTLITRFDTLEYLDLGGFINIRIKMDDLRVNAYMYQMVEACISKDRNPDMDHCDKDNQIWVSDEKNDTLNALKVIPYPEPGKWHIGFRVRCYEKKFNLTETCPPILNAAMISIELRLQPCDYRNIRESCGDHGVCAKATKGQFKLSSCTCLSGYKGWTCDDGSEVQQPWIFQLQTFLLTLTNLAFLPAVILALWYGLYTEALIYFSTMIFSSFYHLCDQEALTMKLPLSLERICMDLYVNREVLQFCDFYSATLSFWITIISLAKLPHRLVNFMNIFGVILVAFLVQYNRSSIAVFVIPIPLGILVLIISLKVKIVRKKRLFHPSRHCLMLFIPALLLATLGFCLVVFVETSLNYPYVHSAWHILMATSLLFFIPRCRSMPRRRLPNVNRNSSSDSLEEAQIELEDASGSNSITSETEVTGMTKSSTSSNQSDDSHEDKDEL